MEKLTVILSVDVEDSGALVKVSEQFARFLAGLALDDIFGTIMIDKAINLEEDD